MRAIDGERAELGGGVVAEPRYEGEDCRSTSRKELFGFYSYSCAIEIVVIAAVSSFLPITLEELARGHGVLQSDRTIPCSTGLIQPPSGSHSSVSPQNGPPKHEQCIVSFLGNDINTASFAMYTFSFSVLVQALVVITMSGAADHGSYRKTLLLIFACTGAVSLMLFLPITSSVYGLGALCAVIANVCLGASYVLLNAYLPLLVRWHPSAHQSILTEESQPAVSDTRHGNEEADASLQHDHDGEEDMMDSTQRLLPMSNTPTANNISSTAPDAEIQLSTQISSYGIGIGYLAALVVQLITIVMVIATGSTNFSLRLALFHVGVWWLIFSLPAAYCLRPRPGPPLIASNNSTSLDSKAQPRSWLSYLTYSWKKLFRTAMQAGRLKDVLLFLAAWFMISDAIATVSGTAILFAKTSLNMRPAALSFINVVATMFGVIGAFSWRGLSEYFGLRPHQTVIACICIFEIIPLYGLLGYIPAIQRAGNFGLQQAWEMYPLGAVYGFVLGGLSSYCRGLFGELIPEGSEAAFYALYAVTDKGSSVFGPAVVGAITDATGEIRPAFWFLAALIALPLIPMMLVDVERGKRQGAAVARDEIPVPRTSIDSHRTE